MGMSPFLASTTNINRKAVIERNQHNLSCTEGISHTHSQGHYGRSEKPRLSWDKIQKTLRKTVHPQEFWGPAPSLQCIYSSVHSRSTIKGNRNNGAG